MAVFAIKVANEKMISDYVRELDSRISSNDFFKNPFKGRAEIFPEADEAMVVVNIEPLYPPVWMISFFFFALYLFYPRWWLFMIASLILSIGFVWSVPFYWLMFFRGCRKKGYTGQLRPVTLSSALRWILGSNRGV